MDMGGDSLQAGSYAKRVPARSRPSHWNGIGMTLESAMRLLLSCIISVFMSAGLDAQTVNTSSTPLRSLQTILEEMVRDEWVPTERDPGWLVLQRMMDEELKQRPHEPLAALIRRAAAYVDVEAANIVVRRSNQLNISLHAQPRFSLDAPIPYVVEIQASVDGGEWFLLGRVRGGSGCGTSRNIVASTLAPGFHRMQLAADVSFLREQIGGSDVNRCEIAGDRHAPAAETLDPTPDNVIQHERRVLPAVSFGIFPNLLGAPTVLAHTLETGLPEVPLAQWLDSVFDAVPEARAISKGWAVDFCRREESSVFMGAWLGGWQRRPLVARRHPRDLCVNFDAALHDDRMISLRLRVGTVHEDAGVWSLAPPTFHDLSLGGSGSVMDVAYLGLLPRVLTTPAGAFPRLDVSVDARDIWYEPADAKPGDPIIIRAALRNVGGRDAPITSGVIGLEAITPAHAVAAGPFVVAEIPVNSSVSVSFKTTMPASGTIVVTLLPFPEVRLFRQGAYSQLVDVESENNLAIKPIGRPKK